MSVLPQVRAWMGSLVQKLLMNAAECNSTSAATEESAMTACFAGKMVDLHLLYASDSCVRTIIPTLRTKADVPYVRITVLRTGLILDHRWDLCTWMVS